MIGPAPACLRCKRFSHDVLDKERRRILHFCEAFPDGDGIPDEIWCMGDKHTKSFPGDRGFLFLSEETKDVDL